MSVRLYQDGILPGGVDTVLPPEWLFFAPLCDNLGASGIDPTPTFTRASVATHKIGSLELEAVTSGVPRFAPAGYFAEGQRTNVITYSEELDNGSTVSGPWWRDASLDVFRGVVSPYVGAPLLATRLLDGPADSLHSIWHEYVGGANQKDALSVFPRQHGRVWCFLAWYDDVGGAVEQYFNLSTGQIGSTVVRGGASLASPAEMELYALDYWRLKIVAQTGAETNRGIWFGPAISDGVNSYVGSAYTVGTYFIGAQVELNVAFVSSYIPTVAAGVTRLQDKLSYPSGNVPVDDGTIEAEFTKYYSGVDAAGSIVETVDAGLIQGARLYTLDDGKAVFKLMKIGSEAEISSTPWTYTPYVTSHIFAPWQPGPGFPVPGATMWVDGTQFGRDYVVAPPTVQNRISIGMDGADASPMWGWVKNVRFWESFRVPG